MPGTRAGSDRALPEAAGRADLLGAVVLRGPDAPPVPVTRPQVQVLLAFLLLESRPVSRGEIAELLWGDRPLADHWQGAVRGVVSKVRDLVAAADLDAAVSSLGDGTVQLVLGSGCTVDAIQAEQAVEAAEGALAAGAPEPALDLVAPWIDPLQQPFLPAGDGDWVRSQQHHLAGVARRAVLVRIEALRATDRPDLASETAAAWVRRNPIDEGVHEQLIRSLLDDGRRGEAVDAYRRLARLLADELGVGPSDAVASLVGGTRPAAAPTAAPAAAPSTGDAPSDAAQRLFLGRQTEMDQLTAAWRATVEEARPHLAVIHGKSGIGKTRLADELGAVAGREGAEVRWARCFPGSGLPFEPLVSAVQTAAPRSGSVAAPTGAALARADALRTIDVGLRQLASRPSVLVIDDLQWASDDVTAALEQTVSGLRGPLLVVATSRNLPAPVHEVLSRIQRSLPTTQVRLRGLEAVDLEPLFDDDGEQAAAQAGELHRRTGGLPFFVTQLALAPRRTGQPIDPASVPDAVRSWIGDRADGLPKAIRSRLDLAAVIGEELTLSTLAACAHVDADEALDQLELLVDDGFLVETDRIDVFAFPHLITRDAIYDRISPTRRARLHLAVAEALAAASPAPGRHAAIAHHLVRSGPAQAVEAGGSLLLAGREALDSGAWALAETFYGEAAAVAPDDPAIRAGALTGLARAAHLQRRRAEAEDLADEVLALTRAHRLPLELAEAVLVLVGRAGRGASQRLSDLEQADLLREALDGLMALDERDPIPRGRGRGDDATTRAERVRRDTLTCHIEGELAQALALTAPVAERRTLVAHAVALAEGIDPPDTHLTARALLFARLGRLDPAEVGDRIADLDQILAIAPSGRSVDATLAALTYRHEDLFICGRRPEAERALDEALDLADRSGHPYWRWATAAWRGLGALVDGDLDRAEQLAFEAVGLAEPGEPGAEACLGVNLVDIRLYQGRSGEVLDLLEGAADASPHIPCYRAVLALCAAEAGDQARALRAYDHFRADAFTAIPDDTNRLLTLVVLADTAAQVGDDGSADALGDLLLPFADLQAVLNCYGGGGAYWGPVAHQLGRLAALAGRPDDADRWFDRAERSARDLGAKLALDRITADPFR